MKSDVIQIYSNMDGREEAMTTAENFALYNRLGKKDAMHMRLLTEELVSMVHGIMDQFKGNLWFESEKTSGGLLCRICLSADKSADPRQEQQLLSVSTSKKNESAKGILGKIREAFRVSAQYAADGIFMDDYAVANSWYRLGTSVSNEYEAERCWSLASYRSNLLDTVLETDEDWDELEKSIIAKLADDVKVWLKNHNTQVTIEKLIKQ